MVLPPLLRPLRGPGMRQLWCGQIAAVLAAEVHLVALAWLALELTGSGLALGMVLGAGLLPRIVITLLGGVAADRGAHWTILFRCNAGRMVVVGLLATGTLLGAVQVWQLYAAGLLLGAISAFSTPALYSAVPRECAPRHRRAGNALMRGTGEAVGVIGPVLGGVLVALVGTGWTLGLSAGLYATASVVLARRRRAGAASGDAGGQAEPEARPGAAPTGRRSLLGDVRESFSVVRRDPFLRRVLILLVVAAVALTGPLTVGIPWLAREEFRVSPSALGTLLAMWAAGSLCGVVMAGSARRLPPWRLLFALLTVVMTLGLLVLGLVPGLLVAAVALLVMGVAAGAFNIILITWLQERAGPERLGRLMSLAELAELVGSPVSYLMAGLVLDLSVHAMYTGAAVVFACGAAAVLLARDPGTGAAPPAAEAGVRTSEDG